MEDKKVLVDHPAYPNTGVEASEKKVKGSWKRITSGTNYTAPKKKRKKVKRTHR